MTAGRKKNSGIVPGAGAARMVEDIVGCKWSLTVLALVRNGVNRPFDFAFDDSQTQLRLSFDAPLNRREQPRTEKDETSRSLTKI